MEGWSAKGWSCPGGSGVLPSTQSRAQRAPLFRGSVPGEAPHLA